jgi:ATP-dependent Clp protease adaptor protein ClpS
MVRQKDKLSPIHQDSETINRELILYNDDVNTFDFVIDTLIEVCRHEPEQAEQCAMIAHFKGKCMVKSGDHYELKPMYEEMTLRGLTVAIE